MNRQAIVINQVGMSGPSSRSVADDDEVDVRSATFRANASAIPTATNGPTQQKRTKVIATIQQVACNIIGMHESKSEDFRRAKMVLFCLHSCEQLIHQKIDRWRLVSFRTSKHARSGFNKRSCFGTRASLYRDGHRLDSLLAFINSIILFAP